MGRAASQWVIQNRDVWSKGPAVLDVLERYLKPSRTLRQSYIIWTPSWGSRCGIAEYTAHLTQEIPGVKVSAGFPGTQGTRLLHIQHEPSLFKNGELTHFIQRMHQDRIPVVVTEHVVEHRVHAWEREADVLLSHTQRGAKILKERWPGKQVVHMPHGCPTWFPPRKRQRGRVVAAFGFLEPHKGFWRLLDALREIPGLELLLYSYAKSSEIEARWERDAQGLAVKRVKQYLPVKEVALQIAAQADALVFWYDEAPFIATSGAVRIGLATGVPVLTSPTGWFQEVRQATYQPDNLIEGLQRLFWDLALQEQLTQRSREYCHENSWPRIAERHLAFWQSIESNS